MSSSQQRGKADQEGSPGPGAGVPGWGWAASGEAPSPARQPGHQGLQGNLAGSQAEPPRRKEKGGPAGRSSAGGGERSLVLGWLCSRLPHPDLHPHHASLSQEPVTPSHLQALKTSSVPCSRPVLTPARSKQLCPTPTPRWVDTRGPSGHGPLGHRQGGCPGKRYLSLRGLPRTDAPLRAPTTSCSPGTHTYAHTVLLCCTDTLCGVPGGDSESISPFSWASLGGRDLS